MAGDFPYSRGLRRGEDSNVGQQDERARTRREVSSVRDGPVLGVVSTTDVLAQYNRTIEVDPTGGAISVQLPTVMVSNPTIVRVKNASGSTNAITINSWGSETIDGASSSVIANAWGMRVFIANPRREEWIEASQSAHVVDDTIHFTEASIDHGSIAGRADDDHAQYALLAGRSGGQTLIGSPTTNQDLTLQGSSGANPGFINMDSPVIFGSYSANPTAAYGFSYTATENFTAGFVGGGLNFSGTISFSNSTFIYESFRGAPSITTGVNPGFAAYTVLQALPALHSGPSVGHNPLNPLILNCGPSLSHAFAGTRTAATAGAVNWSPSLKTTVSGAVLNVTNLTGFINAPKWSTASGSTINFGTIRGLWAQIPAVALFGSSAGVETMAAYYAVDVDNIGAFGGSAPVAALRSAITAAPNQHFLLNNGNAHSDHGAGHIYFDDNAGLAMGKVGVGAYDVWLSWNGSGSYYRTQFFGGQSMRWTNPGTNRFLFDNDGGSTTGEYNWNCSKFSLGAMTGAVGNQVGVFVAGARSTGVGGEWADFLLTQAGNLTVDHTMGNVYAWVINPIAITAGTGSITGEVATLRVGMTTSGLMGAETSALLIAGRRRSTGVDNFAHLSPTALAADADDYAPATGSSMRQVWRVEASGADRTVTGIAVQRTGDTQCIVNVGGTYNVLLSHQDASSTVANRIISPTGASITIGPNEYAYLWHDETTDRWRILDTNGA